MDYLHQKMDLEADDVVEVTFDHPANIMLLDPANYEAYRNRQAFQYRVGGYARKSPVSFDAPTAGIWHLIVDLGGGVGRVRAFVTVSKEPAAV